MNSIISWLSINFKLNEPNSGAWGPTAMPSRMRNGIIVNLNLCASIAAKATSNKAVPTSNTK